MRHNERGAEMMSWLPWYYGDSRIMNEIIHAQSKEIVSIREKVLYILSQFYVDTADFYGISLWEKELGITPKNVADLDLRKAMVKAKLRRPPIMTPKQIDSIINLFFDQGMAHAHHIPGTYHLDIQIPWEENLRWPTEMKEALEAAKPAHLGYLLAYQAFLEEEMQITDNGEGDFLAAAHFQFYDAYPYGTNANVLSRDGILRHGRKAAHNGGFIRGGRGLEREYPPIWLPRHYGEEDLAIDSLSFWPVWMGEENIPVRETALKNFNMSLRVEDRAGEVSESGAAAILYGFHEIVPYGTERRVFSRDSVLEHGEGAKRNGRLRRGSNAFHGMQSVGVARHGDKHDLERERHFFALGYSFEEEVAAEDRGHAEIDIPIPTDNVPKTEEGEAGLEATLIIRRDGSIRHDGKYARGVSYRVSGDFELVRECRNGKMARGGNIAHRESPVQWPA